MDAIDEKTNAEIDPTNDLVEHETVPIDVGMIVEWFVGLVRCHVDIPLGSSLGKQAALETVVLVSEMWNCDWWCRTIWLSGSLFGNRPRRSGFDSHSNQWW